MDLKVLALALVVGCAPVAARADDAARLALAKEFMAQTHFADAMRQALPLLAVQMRTS